VKPDVMNFGCSEGKGHGIYMPAERYEEAHDCFMKGVWEELKKLPKDEPERRRISDFRDKLLSEKMLCDWGQPWESLDKH
jgi:hypothetical protein